jgi:tetratricopeptide (TPR) repeat protein
MHASFGFHRSAWRLSAAAQFMVAICLLVATPHRVSAHADMLIQIDAATADIRKDPGNPDLYIRRGHLYREHAEFELAKTDFDIAETLSPGMQYLNFVRGKLFLEWGWPLTARGYVDRFLAGQPKHTDGLVLRARILQRLGLDRSAVSDFDLALDLSPEPGPDLFVERSQLLMNMGKDHWTEALRGLDDGIKRLGSLVTLQLFAIDAEVKQQQYDGALARVDQIATRSPRKETWLARRGEILVQAGRPAEARKAYEGALAALSTLPPARRNVPAMAELSRRIQREIESLPK